MVQRRQFVNMIWAAPAALAGCSAEPSAHADARSNAKQGKFSYAPGITTSEPLQPPQGRAIKVAFAINPGVQVIDLAGPWETFQDTEALPESVYPTFELFTVSESVRPLRGSGGLSLVPDFTVDNAPSPDVVVVPHFAQPSPAGGGTTAIHQWIRHAHADAALTMSVCTGAFQLAKTGLLDGLPVTTNQQAYDNFAKTFPRLDLRRGPRFVEVGRIATAGGLSAGIDLALRVVTRYFGQGVAQQTADTMEYVGQGWIA